MLDPLHRMFTRSRSAQRWAVFELSRLEVRAVDEHLSIEETDTRTISSSASTVCDSVETRISLGPKSAVNNSRGVMCMNGILCTPFKNADMCSAQELMVY